MVNENDGGACAVIVLHMPPQSEYGRRRVAVSRALGLLALIFVTGLSNAAELPEDLSRAVADYDQAQVKGDRSELLRLLADDYTLLNSMGRIENKTQLIADFTALGYKLEPFVVRDPIVKCWEGGAVLAGITTLRGTERGKAFVATLRFSDIWARRNGAWQVIYTHVSKATDSP